MTATKIEHLGYKALADMLEQHGSVYLSDPTNKYEALLLETGADIPYTIKHACTEIQCKNIGSLTPAYGLNTLVESISFALNLGLHYAKPGSSE